MGTELIHESADVFLYFSSHVTSQAFEKSTQFLLEFALHVLPLVHILWFESPRQNCNVGIFRQPRLYIVYRHKRDVLLIYIYIYIYIYSHISNTTVI